MSEVKMKDKENKTFFGLVFVFLLILIMLSLVQLTLSQESTFKINPDGTITEIQ